jgi:pyruvate,water dikinase
LAAFLERYGMRGVAEVDSGRPRWRENPTQIMQVVQSYLQIDNREQAPDRVFARGAAAATAALEMLVQQLRQTRLGFMKARLARAAGWRMRAFAGYRESPKFHAVRIMGLVRQELLAAGRQLVDEGVLARPDDIFFLHLPELKSLAGGQRQGWLEIVAGRRERYVREQQRQRLPRLLLNDGTTLYEYTRATNGADISGTPVSPGVVVGPVHVVLDPHTAKLAHGDILVCPGTDPAWTPLFLAAGGLITEVGGLMTHGSVVAREYGIPAVVGVPGATTRLKTGQSIRLDGSTGRIVLLDNYPNPTAYPQKETT